MPRHLCIHGHFYQPPREDPWLGDILPEGSAAPASNWNERILRESYAPLAWARRLDGTGRIADIMNCYEWMSFNVGPTLLRWMDRHAPATLHRMIEGDKLSAARWGHGNAIAQVYHHIILPLATPSDRAAEVAWAVADFTTRFGRKPEGMWLAESAVDTPTLETLAAAGIRFTILAPRQAKAVAPADAPPASPPWQPVNEQTLDIRTPYRVDLPSGRSMAVYFYNGPISQAVAFERLLQDGESFWRKLSGAAGEGLLSVCTDGETYGHHFTFGEMALAHVLGQAYSGRDDMQLTNFAAHLAQNPPTQRIQLHEPSSWSCVHGVERWRSNCGCSDGGHHNWHQTWRAPLRAGLQAVKDQLDAHYTSCGRSLFHDSHAALLDYGQVLAHPTHDPTRAAFAQRHFLPDITAQQQDTAWKLLTMQEAGLASFASCAWFFDDLSRIEPVNALTFALRGIDLCMNTGGPDTTPLLLEHLAHAQSNKPEEGSGVDICNRHVLPRKETPASLILQALHTLAANHTLPQPNGAPAQIAWPETSVEIRITHTPASTTTPELPQAGEATIRTGLAPCGDTYHWQHHTDGTLSATAVNGAALSGHAVAATGAPTLLSTTSTVHTLPRNRRAALAVATVQGEQNRLAKAQAPAASMLLQLIDPWDEAQHDMPHGPDWLALLPTLVYEAVMRDEANIPDADSTPPSAPFQQLVTYAQQAMPEACRAHAASRLRNAFVQHLQAPEVDWSMLATRLRRAHALLPHMDWWEVQNAFHAAQATAPDRRPAPPDAQREVAQLLGFRV